MPAPARRRGSAGRTPWLSRTEPRRDRIERGRGHPERREEARADVLPVWSPADALDDLAQQLIGEVRVLPLEARRHCRRDLGDARERRSRVALVADKCPVRPRRLTLEAGLVREHATDRQRLDRSERAGCFHELGEIRDRGIVERELSLVSQLHDRGSGERLRDRGDPVKPLRVERRFFARSAYPIPFDQTSSPSVDDADGCAGNPVLLDELRSCRLVAVAGLCGGARHAPTLPRTTPALVLVQAVADRVPRRPGDPEDQHRDRDAHDRVCPLETGGDK